jgi:hypothetical protein
MPPDMVGFCNSNGFRELERVSRGMLELLTKVLSATDRLAVRENVKFCLQCRKKAINDVKVKFLRDQTICICSVTLLLRDFR